MIVVYRANSKRFNRQLALTGPVQQGLRAKAEAVAQTMRALAAGHGGLPAKVAVEHTRGKVDWFATIRHEHMLSIEVGHLDEVFDSGWVPGLHIARDAAAAHK
ncbi:MAG: DUF5403 family protein [Propionibacteriaceae bacterium]|nr:DUF5403 family protein [Propionibacteriaceae bacterium]